jgi:membrane associated rhomboid family serine protease
VSHVATIVLIGVVLFIAYRVTTPESRQQYLAAALAVVQQVKEEAQKAEARSSGLCQPFREALRARTKWTFATPTLAALNALIFLRMLSGSGAIDDPKTLISWGANLGPLTTNGDWWRLVTSMFINTGLLRLLINIAGLIQVGLLLERLLGPLTVVAVYVAAGVLANLANLSGNPLATSTGPTGAILGLYGLLLASRLWSTDHRTSVTIPLVAVKRLTPAAILFVLFSLPFDGFALKADLVGFVTGLTCGLFLAQGVSDAKPRARRVAMTMAPTIAIAAVSAFSQRGITDAKAEIARVVAVEDRTAGAYSDAADRFRKGRINADGLVQLIDRTIMPELHATDARLKALTGVPQEQRQLVADAQEYLRLRSESWRLRADGLRKASTPVGRGGGKADGKGKGKSINVQPESGSDTNWRLQAEKQYRSNMVVLANAEGTERASLEVLNRIKPADQK